MYFKAGLLLIILIIEGICATESDILLLGIKKEL